jgi:hypothetical protein
VLAGAAALVVGRMTFRRWILLGRHVRSSISLRLPQ